MNKFLLFTLVMGLFIALMIYLIRASRKFEKTNTDDKKNKNPYKLKDLKKYAKEGALQ